MYTTNTINFARIAKNFGDVLAGTQREVGYIKKINELFIAL